MECAPKKITLLRGGAPFKVANAKFGFRLIKLIVELLSFEYLGAEFKKGQE